MTVVTADTNIYISGLQFGGVPLHLLNEARARAFRLAVSPSLLHEIRRVLREKFAWPDVALDDVFARLARFTTVVHPTRTVDAVPDDPDDNRIIECAVESGSGYIVTGDHHLLRLGSYGGIDIVRAADFLKLLPSLS